MSAEARLEPLGGHHVDAVAEEILQEDKQTHVAVEGRRPLEFDENVDVAVGLGLVAGYRAEERE